VISGHCDSRFSGLPRHQNQPVSHAPSVDIPHPSPLSRVSLLGSHRMASDLMFELPLETERRRKERRGRRRKPIHILELPHEVLLTILDFSCQTPTELVRFSLVCSLFHRFTEAEPLWRKVCMNSFDSIHPLTLSRSGSWKSLLKNKALIENSPWTVKPKEAVQTLHNELLGTRNITGLARLVCGTGTGPLCDLQLAPRDAPKQVSAGLRPAHCHYSAPKVPKRCAKAKSGPGPVHRWFFAHPGISRSNMSVIICSSQV
jgi:hypothetical protein